MQIWLDTINVDIIEEAVALNLVSGITTNPSILSKTKDVRSCLKHLLEIQMGRVAVQVTATDTKGMIEEGKQIFDFSDRFIVKIPVNAAGLGAIYNLSLLQIPVLATAIFDPIQALLAANNGAAYITPYFSHIKGDASETLKNIKTILSVNQYKSKLLVASIKTLEDLEFCSLIGADSVTIKEDLYPKLVANHHLWDKCNQKFTSEWVKAHGDVSIIDLLNT